MTTPPQPGEPWSSLRPTALGPTVLRGVLSRLAPRSFRGQIVVSTVLLMTGVLICVGVGVQVLLALTARHDVDRVLEDRAGAVVAAIDASSHGDGAAVTVPAGVLDPGVRVYDAEGQVVAGAVERKAIDVADDLARRMARGTGTTPAPRTVTVHEDLRLLARPFTTSSGQHGVVVVSQSTTPYERSETYALVATTGIGLLVVALTAAIARRVTSQALVPVTVMAERATEWSEHDLAHRFDLGPPDNELARLGATLDGLLDRVAMAIRAEQRLSSELAHELRTPLTVIQGSADLALLRGIEDDDLRAEVEQVVAAARAMSTVITTLVDVARDQAPAGSAATSRIADVVGELRALVPHHLTFVDETSGSTARLAGPSDLVLRALAPLVDNAVAHARSTVSISAVDTPHAVEVWVVDDGPGVDPAVRDRLFDPGASGRGTTGLGLGIAQRVVRSLGGSLRVDDAVAGGDEGARFVVSLPRA